MKLVRAGLVAWPFVLWAVLHNRPPWGDEVHFLATVRQFGEGWSLPLLRTYPEMSGPLTFLLYSAWGWIAGFSTPALRLLSPVVAGAVALIWYEVLRRRRRSSAITLMALGSVLLNPYFVGLSVFVFTDMCALLGLCVVVWSVETRRPWLAAIGLAIATAARQYLVFLAPALVLAALLSRQREGARATSGFVLATIAGMIPLGLLVAAWGGHLSPTNHLRDIYLSGGLHFDLHALSLYLALPAAYLALLVVPLAARANQLWWWGLLPAALVWMFPVQASLAQTREGVTTVGFLHRASVAAFFPAAFSRPLFSMLAAITGVAVLTTWRGRRQNLDDVFLWCAVASFLVVMPFSYLPWEKYALPLLMLLSAMLPQTPESTARISR